MLLDCGHVGVFKALAQHYELSPKATQAADAALAAAIRLLRDVNIIERFVDVKQDSYSKNRLGQGPTPYYEKAKVIKGDKADVDRITNHVLGDACTPGNAKECTFDTVRPVVEHCMNGDLDELLP